MATNSRACRCSGIDRFYPIWLVNPDAKFQVKRFVLGVVAILLTMYGVSLVSVLSDSYYNPGELPSLPDRLHDQILKRQMLPPAFGVLVDTLTFLVVFCTCMRNIFLLPFPFNLQVSSRFLTLSSFLYWMRAVAILVTTVPPAKPNCNPPRPASVEDVLKFAFAQAMSHNVECTGMIISGHSVSLMSCILCWALYGQSQSAPAMKAARVRSFYCADVTCEGAPHDTFRGCFLRQLYSFGRRWILLRRSGCASPMETAAAECFSPCRYDMDPSPSDKREGRWRCLCNAVMRLPLLRYLCYIQAICALVLIPMCFNHYLIDVYLATMLTFLWWFLYHLILTIQVVQAQGSEHRWTRGAELCASCLSSSVPPGEDWKGGVVVSCKPGEILKATPAEVAACNASVTEANKCSREGLSQQHGPGGCLEVVDIELSRAGGANRGRVDTIEGLVAANQLSSFTRTLATAESASLNLGWILGFPILQPLSWCIRNMEGI